MNDLAALSQQHTWCHALIVQAVSDALNVTIAIITGKCLQSLMEECITGTLNVLIILNGSAQLPIISNLTKGQLLACY